MYSYYGLSVFGPQVRKYLWWKQYLTVLQLVQFTGGLMLGLNGIFTGCTFTRWMQYLVVFYMLSFMVLFGNFYRNAYNHGLRAAYRMEMKKRQLQPASNEQSTDQKDTNGYSNYKNGHVLKSVEGLRNRASVAATMTNGLLIEAGTAAPHLAKHGTS